MKRHSITRSPAAKAGVENLRRLQTDLILEGHTPVNNRELHEGIKDLIRMLKPKV